LDKVTQGEYEKVINSGSAIEIKEFAFGRIHDIYNLREFISLFISKMEAMEREFRKLQSSYIEANNRIDELENVERSEDQ
jgi:hypothetical protein